MNIANLLLGIVMVEVADMGDNSEYVTKGFIDLGNWVWAADMGDNSK